MTGLELDLSRVPWSHAGSFMAVSTVPRPPEHPGGRPGARPGVVICDVSGSRLFRWNAVFGLTGLVDGTEVEPVVLAATPSLLTLGVGAGARVVELTWEGADTVRVRARGCGVRLAELVVDELDSAVVLPDGPDAWRLQMGEDAHYVVTRLRGALRVSGPAVRTGASASTAAKLVEARPGADGVAEIALTQYESGYRAPTARPDFDDCVSATAAVFDVFRRRYPRVPPDLEPAADLAAYVVWSCLAGPRGLLTRPAVLMSKNWMHAVWSWDHAFNAVGLAVAHPGLAWDQFMVVLDQQHPQGALPDITTDAARFWGFVKPPVHGWALRRLRAAGGVDDDRLAEVYPRLAGWTQWWLDFRDLDGDGLAAYFHGNDSGQDNATAFDVGFPATAPDLAAFLVVQLDVLADLAHDLGREAESAAWRERADAVLAGLLRRLWDGDRFVVRGPDDRPGPPTGSQLQFLPLVLGDRLPGDVRAAVVRALRASGAITPFGLASESPASPLYEADGYWRGPVWAPTTLLVADGLAACGEHDLARSLAEGFLAACRASGFAENYDAVTGAGLRDPAYSWSAAVFWTLLGDEASGGASRRTTA